MKGQQGSNGEKGLSGQLGRQGLKGEMGDSSPEEDGWMFKVSAYIVKAKVNISSISKHLLSIFFRAMRVILVHPARLAKHLSYLPTKVPSPSSTRGSKADQAPGEILEGLVDMGLKVGVATG